MGLSSEELQGLARAWVDKTCREQGVATKVTNASTVASVAMLLSGKDLVAPERRKPRRVKTVATAQGGADAKMVNDVTNDLLLPGETQLGPLSTQAGGVADESFDGEAS